MAARELQCAVWRSTTLGKKAVVTVLEVLESWFNGSIFDLAFVQANGLAVIGGCLRHQPRFADVWT